MNSIDRNVRERSLSRFCRRLLAAVGCVVLAASSVQAGVVVIGNVEPPLPWDSGTLAYVGRTAYGRLTVDGGSTLASRSAYLGYNPGVTGEVFITGAGSKWNVRYGVTVGYEGTGTLLVEAGAEVISSGGDLGVSSGSTGTATVTGAGSKWLNSGHLYVGNEGTGTLTVADEGLVTARTLWAGNLLGNGTISVEGAVLDAELVFDRSHGLQQTIPFGSGGRLNLNVTGRGALGVGYKGVGSLRIAEGVQVNSSDGYLGYWADSTGTATVTGAGSKWLNSRGLYVGHHGSGTLRVEAGAEVTSGGGTLGRWFGSTGTATVTGTGSKWTNSGALLVGAWGTGTLRVEARAQVSSGSGTLGTSSGSTGTATVTGAGSKWLNSDDLYVGQGGSGTLLVEAGAEVRSRSGWLAEGPGSTGTATVTGAGSQWVNSRDLHVGYDGSGTLLVEAGAVVTSRSGSLGSRAGSTGAATVTGAGSKWLNSGDLYVGQGGSGTLTVADGGLVTGRTLWARPADLLGNGTISVEGAVLDAELVFDATHGLQQTIGFGSGGRLNLNVTGRGALGAGYKGVGSLRIAEGVQVNSFDGYLGYWGDSTATATVTGAGSKWNVEYGLTVGYWGTGTLLVEAGAVVTSSSGSLGSRAGSTGAATVTGAGSKWNVEYGLRVGDWGTGTLLVEAGAEVNSGDTLLGGWSSGTGTATVTGAGSKWNVEYGLTVGYWGTGTLLVEAGAEVSSGGGHLGSGSASTGTATVTGAGSKWTNSGDLYVGYEGGGTLTVADGGLVTASTLWARPADLLGNGTISVEGAVLDAELVFDATHGLQQTIGFGSGGRLNLNVTGRGALGAGYKGVGSLRIADGVQVNSSDGYLGYWGDSTATATVTGAGSKWNMEYGLTVGYWGTGTLLVEAGAEVSSEGGFLGDSFGSTGTATVTGTGSKWRNTGDLLVGRGGNGTLRVEAGAEVSSRGGTLGSWYDSTGTATVTGAGSKWTNSGDLYVGRDGDGTLLVEAGAEVSSDRGYLGYDWRSTGTATVTGAGSKWLNSGHLYVGIYGTGTLTISGGGEVTASSVYINDRSLLAIDVGYGSLLSVGAGSGRITNNGLVRVVAGPEAAAGSQHAPIAAGTWSGTGIYQAVGGSWDPGAKVFTVSAVRPGTSGTPAQLDLTEVQRTLIHDPVSGWSVGASFLNKTGQMNFTATAIGGQVLSELEALLPLGDVVLGAWEFAAGGSGYSPGDPIYLSFKVGSGLSRSDLRLWHYDGSNWSSYTADDLTYAGQYASFTVTDFSGYAVSVPEPGTLALLATVAAMLLWLPVRRKCPACR